MMKQAWLAAAAATLGLASGAQAACSLNKLTSLNVVVENDQILIPGTMQGQKVKFLFDTAYPANVMPSSAAGRLGVAVAPLAQPSYISEQDMEGNHSIGGLLIPSGAGKADPEISLDGRAMRGVTFGVFESKDNFGPGEVAGAISGYVWRNYEVEIDLQHNLITLYESKDCAGTNFAYWAQNYNVVDLTESGVGAEFPVKLNGREVTAILDSGSPYSTLAQKAADKLGIDRPSSVAVVDASPPVGVQSTDLASLIRFTHGYGLEAQAPNIVSNNVNDLGPQTPKSYWPAPIATLTIDQEVISHPVMRVVPSPRVGHEFGTRTPRNLATYDVLLGVDFLKTHRVLISHNQKKLYFSYVGGALLGKP